MKLESTEDELLLIKGDLENLRNEFQMFKSRNCKSVDDRLEYLKVHVERLYIKLGFPLYQKSKCPNQERYDHDNKCSICHGSLWI